MSILIDLPIPPLSDVLRSVRRSLTAEYRAIGLSAFLPNNLLYPLGVILSRLQIQGYLLAREAASQATPFGATGNNLDLWLKRYSVTVPAAARATGTVILTGSNNEVVPSGTELVSVEGLVYTLTGPAAFGASTGDVTVAAEASAVGSQFNRAPGDRLELAYLSDFVNPEAQVVTMGGGSNPADDAQKEALLQARMAQGGTAGTLGDYRLKVLSFNAAFAEVYLVEAGRGPGTIAIFPVLALNTGQAPYEVNVPSAGELDSLQVHLEAVRKVNDRPIALAVALVTYDVELSISPDTTDTRAAVSAALGARLAAAYRADGYTIPNSEINAAIGNADGVTAHTLLDVDGGGPLADVVAAFGQFAVLGTVTFT